MNTTKILKSLEDGLEQFLKGDTQRYMDYLRLMSHFHHYSVNNIMLIYLQRPDSQLVNSFTGWRQIGRYVKRGEKGIAIIAPIILRKQEESEGTEEPPSEASRSEKVFFRVTKVFDVSQTDGEELPLLDVPELSTDVPDYQRILAVISGLSPVPINYAEIKGEAKGFFDRCKEEIVVKKNMAQLQTIKTLLHEIAHARMHSDDSIKKSREVRETEAESVAYVVCQALHLDTSDYSFPYLTSWSNAHDLTELRGSLAVIQQTADECIQQIYRQM